MSFLRHMFTLRPLVPIVRLEGVIENSSRGFGAGRSLNIANTSRSLERAFALPWVKAVALVINSPGGSAAQSHLIAQRVINLAKEKDKQVIAFVEDVAASGGYFLALGADEIYADPFSIIGSIGVIYAGFGMKDAMHRLGIERRLHTAGKNKSLLDPFQDEKEEDKKRLREMLDGTHAEFKAFVKQRRGDRLKQPDDVLFEGDFWLAGKALEYGLIDGLGDVRSVLTSKFGRNTLLPVISPSPSLFMPGAAGASAAAAGAVNSLRASLHWERFGL